MLLARNPQFLLSTKKNTLAHVAVQLQFISGKPQSNQMPLLTQPFLNLRQTHTLQDQQHQDHRSNNSTTSLLVLPRHNLTSCPPTAQPHSSPPTTSPPSLPQGGGANPSMPQSLRSVSATWNSQLYPLSATCGLTISSNLSLTRRYWASSSGV